MKINFRILKGCFKMYCLEIKIGKFFRSINLSKHTLQDGRNRYGVSVLPF